jgi:hypothetical protein
MAMWGSKKKSLKEQNRAIEKLARDGILKISNVPIREPMNTKLK